MEEKKQKIVLSIELSKFKFLTFIIRIMEAKNEIGPVKIKNTIVAFFLTMWFSLLYILKI